MMPHESTGGDVNFSELLTKATNILICCRDGEGRFLSGNQLCLTLCKPKTNRVCSEGCTKHFSLKKESHKNQSPFIFKNRLIQGQPCDLLVTQEGLHYWTFLFIKVPGKERSNFTQQQIEDLTPKEKEIMLLKSEGFANREIAIRLSIQTSTVKSHINRILSKIRAR